MKSKCKLYLAIKGRIQPGCSCGACWDIYFRTNPGKYEGAKLALKQFGFDNLVDSQVAQYRQARIVNPEMQLRMQATRFAKQVQRCARMEDKKAKAKAEAQAAA